MQDSVRRVQLEQDVTPVTGLRRRLISVPDLTSHVRVKEEREIEQTSAEVRHTDRRSLSNSIAMLVGCINQLYSSKNFDGSITKRPIRNRPTHSSHTQSRTQATQVTAHKASNSALDYCDWQTLHNKLSSKLHFNRDLYS